MLDGIPGMGQRAAPGGTVRRIVTVIVVLTAIVPTVAITRRERAGAAGAGIVASIGGATVVEGDDATRALTIPVTLSRPATTTVTLAYRIISGSATVARARTPGVDVVGSPATKTLRFVVGARGVTPVTKSVSLPVVGDTLVEGDESFTVTLTGASGALVGRATGTGTILDDDGHAAETTLGIGDVTIVEGDQQVRTAHLRVTLSSARATATTFSWFVVPAETTGDVRAGRYGAGVVPIGTDVRDDLGAAHVATIRPGARGVAIPIAIFPDEQREPDERFLVGLSDVDAAVSAGRVIGIGRIVDDDEGSVGAIFSWVRARAAHSEASTPCPTSRRTASRRAPTGGRSMAAGFPSRSTPAGTCGPGAPTSSSVRRTSSRCSPRPAPAGRDRLRQQPVLRHPR